MVNQLYDALNRYFNTLSNTGYVKQSSVEKLFVFSMIEELLCNDFRAYITESDYQYIVQALYCLYGSDCLLPYPDYYKNDNSRIMYNGSTSELAYRVSKLEEGLEETNEIATNLKNDWDELRDKPIVVPSDV